jgi:hypothetical protein
VFREEWMRNTESRKLKKAVKAGRSLVELWEITGRKAGRKAVVALTVRNDDWIEKRLAEGGVEEAGDSPVSVRKRLLEEAEREAEREGVVRKNLNVVVDEHGFTYYWERPDRRLPEISPWHYKPEKRWESPITQAWGE